ncbi:hypothetical protein QR685DRAFT_433561 [Neurospora intermedia]|uniref:Uncharacterized protein n=1 Tax=Neurospora intermedia TaxID=5142 RepID=A0ABR3DP74_NEUIN
MPLDLHPSFLSVTTNPGGLQRPECRESRLGHTFFSLWGFAFSKWAKDVDDEWIGGIAARPWRRSRAVGTANCKEV